MLKRAQYLLDGRLFEWTFSAGALWLAVETTAFSHPSVVSVYAGAVALAGMVALFTNGRSFFWGPIVRSVCATGRSYLWAQMAYALFLLGQTQTASSLDFGFWVLFACAELYVAFRAMGDVQRVL